MNGAEANRLIEEWLDALRKAIADDASPRACRWLVDGAIAQGATGSQVDAVLAPAVERESFGTADRIAAHGTALHAAAESVQAKTYIAGMSLDLSRP